MPSSFRSYNDQDTSKFQLKFEDDHFPAFLRLSKWKILDYCVSSYRSPSDIGDFKRFEPLFSREELQRVVEKIVSNELPEDEFAGRIAAADLDEKNRKQAEMYAKFRQQHAAKVQRRRFIEFFLNKVLYTEYGIRLADELIFDKSEELYGMLHWDGMPSDWAAADTFRQKFFDPLETDRTVNQKLDKVAGCARGNLILPYFGQNSRISSEYRQLKHTLQDEAYQLQTSLVKEALEEGPVYHLKMVDGEEKKVAAERWTEHETKLMFMTLVAFQENEKREAGEHEEWFYYLLEAMRNDPHNRAALHFLNPNYAEELDERENERQRKSMLALRGSNHLEEGLSGLIPTSIREQPKDDHSYQSDADVDELKLRSYQEELVQPALEKKNCVIVAPTGSGKTEVAVYAALHHIGERSNRRQASRVVFLVPTTALVGQQKERVLKYCRGQYRVNGFHGSEASKTGEGRRDEVLACHVAVMTPQILLNMLESVREHERLFVSDFSMVIFDEVHRATGDHAYVKVSRAIQEWPHDKPQIIGLTASLNVSATGHTDTNRMLEGIYQMLAILDTPTLSTITKQENIDELNKIVGKPDDSIEVCTPSTDTEAPLRAFIKRHLALYHLKLCNELDGLAKARHNSFSQSFLRAFRNEKTERFEMFEAKLQSVSQELNKMNTADKSIAQMYAKYIRVYVEARGIVEVMPQMVAFEFMTEAIEKLDATHTLTQFNDFAKNRELLLKSVNDTDHVEPTIVTKLKKTIISQFTTQRDSRVIIFVTQRSTAKRVAGFLNKSKIMDDFSGSRDTESVGYVLGVNNSGAIQQSVAEQTMVLDRFNNGKLKVLVATSVIEEGLDVTACNLIIKYNCSSGSAIQLIQQRGRARAKNSRSVLLAVSSSVNMQENNAMLAEKYMKHCIAIIMKNSQRQLVAEVEKVKEVLAKERERELHERAMERQRHENKSYHVKCSSCNRLFCESTAIRKVNSNYMVMVPQVWDNILLVSKIRKVNKYTEDCALLCNIQCEGCKHDIGKAYKMRGVYLPQLTVKALTFAPSFGNPHDSTETKAKWKDVENNLFFIPDAEQYDYARMLNALSNTEANMEKKRQLDLDSKQLTRAIEIQCHEFDRKARQKPDKKVNVEVEEEDEKENRNDDDE